MNELETYCSRFPPEVRDKLLAIRTLIRELAPEAEESISYGMPTYKTDRKPLVYFGAYKNHIGFYAMPSGHREFQEELSRYKQGKGSVQFPLTEHLPYPLIEKMVKFRIAENRARARGDQD